MFNVYNAAQQFTQILNPPVEVTFFCLPQTQEWHTDEPDPNVGTVSYTVQGTVQTYGVSTDVLVNTLNSPRLFKIYISYNQDILSLVQTTAREVIAEFTYHQMGAVQARIDSFSDYRYNGWVCLTATQCVPKHYTHHLFSQQGPGGGFGGYGGYNSGFDDNFQNFG